MLAPLILKNRLITAKIPVRLRVDTATDGEGDTGRIVGIVTEKEIPVRRRVFCYYRKSGRLISTTMSSSNGHYEFTGLIAGAKYFVTSLDENNDATQYNAVVQDLIIADEV